MKIYILADMEGISGILFQEQVQSGSPKYAAACDLMMQDMNTAIAAAFEGGATEVVACDTHGGGGQIRIEQMDPRARYETPNAGEMMPALDESFDGLVLLGHHARAGTRNAFLDHTMDSMRWFEYRINDLPVGEIGIEAAYGGHFNVPVIAVSGDAAAAAEATELLGEVCCAVVKWGVGRNRARCLSIPQAHERIHQAVVSAVQSIGRFKTYKPALPATLELRLYRSDMADELSRRMGVERLDARTLRHTIESFKDILAAF
jgi:D-amino peptidase